MCKIHCEAGVFFFSFLATPCFQPLQSHTVVSEWTFWFASSRAHNMEGLVWLEIPGPCVNGHKILSQLTLPGHGGSGLIYDDIQSGEKLAIRAWRGGCLVCAEAFWAYELSSAGRTHVGSPDVRGPAHLHRVRERVDLSEQARRTIVKLNLFGEIEVVASPRLIYSCLGAERIYGKK